MKVKNKNQNIIFFIFLLRVFSLVLFFAQAFIL